MAACLVCSFSTRTLGFSIWDYESTINVSFSGNDSLGCLEGRFPCETLGYALNGVENMTVIFMEDGDHELVPSEGMRISLAKHVAIVAEKATVTCVDGAGLGFIASRDIFIRGISWIGCAIDHPSSALYNRLGIVFPTVTSALFFQQCLNVTITNCSFTSQNGSGVSMYDVGGVVQIQRCDFTGHSQKCTSEPCLQLSRGLTIEFTYCGGFKNCSEPGPATEYNSGARYSVEECVFISNNNTYGGRSPQPDLMEGSEYWPYGKGGGMAMIFRGRSRRNVIAVTTGRSETASRAFARNSANLGGSVYVEFLDEASGNNVSWIGPFSVSLSSAEIGGAVHLSAGLLRTNGSANAFLVKDVAITNNQATWGGGFTLFSSPSSDGSVVVNFQSCSWLLNTAKTGADAVGVSQLGTSVTSVSSGTVIAFDNCIFRENDFALSSGYVSAYQSRNFAHCSISTDGLPLVFNTATISDSSGPALCASSSSVHVKGDVRFLSNGLRTRPVYGGGLLLRAGSTLLLSGNGTRLVFENNTALYYGGGIYFEGVSAALPQGQRNALSNCAFGYEDASTPAEVWSAEARVEFVNNQVANPSGAGRGMYLAGAVDESCKRLIANVTEGWLRGDVASTGTSVELHPPAVRVGRDAYKMEVMYGQYITINATATDCYDNVAETTLQLVSLDPRTMQPVVSFNGTASVVVREGPIYTNIYLQDLNGMSEIYLLLTDLANIYFFIHVSFITRLGFVFDPSRQIYSCFASERMLCNRTTLEVWIQTGFWYGELQGGGNNTTNTVAPCSPLHCQFTGKRCSQAASDAPSPFCLLSGNQDDQCGNNRGGVLCSRCRYNHSFTYDALQCVPSQTCSALHTVFFTFCIILFWVAIIVFATVILQLNAKLGTGCTFAFIYYFSVVPLLLPSNPPSLFLKVAVDVFSGIVQLNPRFLGLIEWCAFESLDNLGYWTLRYLHPLVFLLVMLVLSVVKWSCKRFPRTSLNKIPSAQINCLLFVLVFSSLSEVSLKLLTPVSLNSRLYVAVEPSAELFDEAKHLPHVLLALVVECALLLPSVLVLAFGPLVDRLRSSHNRQSNNGMLSEYQTCYRRGSRWVASFYFIARQAVFLVPVLCLSTEVSSVFFLQVLTVFTAVLHTVLQPYKRSWLNVVDALLLFDLALVSLLNSTGLPPLAASILLHFLVLVPWAYPAAVFVWLGVNRIRRRLRSSCEAELSVMSYTVEKKASNVPSDVSDSPICYEGLMDRHPRKDHYHSISVM